MADHGSEAYVLGSRRRRKLGLPVSFTSFYGPPVGTARAPPRAPLQSGPARRRLWLGVRDTDAGAGGASISH